MVKSNAGKTYPDAIVAYENILKQKKAVVLILLFSSTFDKKRVTAIVALSVISLTIIVGATVPLANAGKFRFTASPSVFDRGENYVVVWSTNVPSAGRIEYSFDGKDFVVFDENPGRINLSDSIHSVIVPKNHLDGTEYTVYSNKVLENVAYGSQTGKEIAFSATFSTEKTSDFTLNVMTDNHDTDKKLLKKSQRSRRVRHWLCSEILPTLSATKNFRR